MPTVGPVRQVVETDRGCFACMLGGDEGKTLFVLANNWGGPASMGDGAGTGQVLTIEVDISRAGWP